MSPSRRPLTLVSEFVNQSPLQNTCEATDGLTLFRVTSCVDSVHKNQYTNDEFFTASQATSRFDGSTAHRCLCVRTGSGIMEARPHPRALPPPRTTWPKSASRVYSVLQSKWPIRAPSRFEPVDPRERDGND